MISAHRLLLSLAAVFGASLLAASPACSAPARGGAPPSPHKRALIVAITHYAQGTGWRQLASENDVPILQAALEGQGFTDIRVLRDAEATRQGIVAAFRETLLQPARPGDIVVFHFSGHGQQITDDNGDELDGYDEALVPYDAPFSPRPEDHYKGEKHLRDDELNILVQTLRRQIGPKGNVAVFLDSCFSGTPRGQETDRPGHSVPRGGPPIGPPAPGARAGADEGVGIQEKPPARLHGLVPSPYVVISAARNDELAWQTTGDDGKPVGSLSYALARELPALPEAKTGAAASGDGAPTYRLLFERLQWLMAKRVSNQPQAEGDRDTLVFSGHTVHQRPFLEIHANAVLSPTHLELHPGTLAGLLSGSRIEVHREGAAEPSDASLLAKGRVVNSTLLMAPVDLETPIDTATLSRARAFVTQASFGALSIRVMLEGLDDGLRAKIVETLQNLVAAVEVVNAMPDLIVRPRTRSGGPSEIVVERAGDGFQILSLPADSPKLDDTIGNRLLDYARNQYLRGLNIRDDAFAVSLELLPAQCPEPPDPDTCTLLDPATKWTKGGEQVWRAGDYFKLRVKNPSARQAHLAVLDLAPDGTIHVLWPEAGTQDSTSLASGNIRILHNVNQVDHYESPGTEVLLLVATSEYVDFTPFATAPSLASRGTPTGPLGPLAPLFDDTFVRARSTPTYPRGSINTSAVVFRVVP